MGRKLIYSEEEKRLLNVRGSMIHRCHGYVRDFLHKYYKDRGISVCEKWRRPEGKRDFIKWALNNGYKQGLEIDRINNDGNYDPQNCRFVTHAQNSANRKFNRK
jgi:hypothetical protein